MFLTVVLTIFITVPILLIVIIWYDSHSASTPYLTFNAFKSFYNINPERWTLYSDFVSCHIDDSQKDFATEENRFQFHLFDFHRYKKWTYDRKKRNQDINKAKITAAMIASVQSDINRTHIEESCFRKALEEKIRRDLGV